jgi:hypothetical protein
MLIVEIKERHDGTKQDKILRVGMYKEENKGCVKTVHVMCRYEYAHAMALKMGTRR